jgi:hypothetical protein
MRFGGAKEQGMYLTRAELGQQSGLSLAAMTALETAGLLRPDQQQPEPLYRPKLATWGQKLAYLLEQGWTITEIKQWSSERWTWPKPKVWPPPKPGKGQEKAISGQPQGSRNTPR